MTGFSEYAARISEQNSEKYDSKLIFKDSFRCGARYNCEFTDANPAFGWIGSHRGVRDDGGLFMAAGMTKTQLVRHLAGKLGTNNKTSSGFLEKFAEIAIQETKKNGVFVVPGLGRLVKAHRKARVGRNLQSGDLIQIKAKTVVKFRVAKAVREEIDPPPPKDRIIRKAR